MKQGSQSLAGHLLIAMPNLADPNFWQSVVLLGVHSDDEGAFGLIINRSLDIDLNEILEELGEEVVAGELPEVHGGGPVQPSHGFVLYERGEQSPRRLLVWRATATRPDTSFSWDTRAGIPASSNARSRRTRGWSHLSTPRSSSTSRSKSGGLRP
jgi:putative AlgH/UPF0301 family transcriptional regulator